MKTKTKPKPRLSIKLLWKIYSGWTPPLRAKEELGASDVPYFLDWVELKVKTPKP